MSGQGNKTQLSLIQSLLVGYFLLCVISQSLGRAQHLGCNTMQTVKTEVGVRMSSLLPISVALQHLAQPGLASVRSRQIRATTG